MATADDRSMHTPDGTSHANAAAGPTRARRIAVPAITVAVLDRHLYFRIVDVIFYDFDAISDGEPVPVEDLMDTFS